MKTTYTDKPKLSEVLAAAKIIEKVGAYIGMDFPGGEMSLSPEDLVDVLQDEDAWLAKQYGISTDRFKAWRVYMQQNQQCTGNTRNGKQCKNRGGAQYVTPQRFVPGESDRCSLHVDLSS